MEKRLYFVVGDMLACGSLGAAAGWLAFAAMPQNWWFPVTMVLGMFLGMVVGSLGGFLFSPFFGAMEIALPTALAGMLAGMAGGMQAVMPEMDAGEALRMGAGIGILCLAFTYLLQSRLNGEVG
ncbi:MAG: hypothetical protein QF797_12910 [Alphaproteobacteria bacterium]|nr:hypothetical protein [Alphaproteobacteria bacterium]